MDEGEDMDVSLDGAHTKRACDSCRTRKIRCDRSVPCANCKASKLTCTTSAPAQKAQRQRVHISEEYEKKIDRIEDRLAGIENVLESLASKLGDLDIRRDSVENSSHSRSSRVGTGKSPGTLTEPATPAPFEGETALNSQSDYARELLAQVVGRTPSIGQNAEIKSALNALEELVTQQGQNTATAGPLINRALADINHENLERPPWSAVALVLDKATKYPTMAFAVVFPFLKMRNLKEIFEDAYHNPGTCSVARRLLAYGIMENLFTEFSAFSAGQMEVANFGTYSVLCRRHLQVAMSQLDIFMLPSYENIMALVLGAAQSIEMSKPSLSWSLISSAAGLAQNLGYHRINTMTNDAPEDRKAKIYIFWMIYMFDKILALRLGRASVIQDWDISLPFVLSDEGTPHGPEGSQMLSYWIKVARVQGQTYEKLFSPAAFLRPPEERTRTAIQLVNAMNVAWYERGETIVEDFTAMGQFYKPFSPQQEASIKSGPNETELPSKRNPLAQQTHLESPEAVTYKNGTFERVQDIFFHADTVMHYSTCALIQRAVTPDNVNFNQECLESSRAALVAHMRANSQFNVEGNEELWSGYIHWSILQAPFTPFIVLFSNAIQNVDSSDLASLSDFVTSLESCRTISEGANKLYKMCHLFLRVARLYITAKSQEAPATAQPPSIPQSSQPNYYTTTDGTQLDLSAMTQFDPYLSALGLMPNSAWPMASFGNATPSVSTDVFSHNQGTGAFTSPEVAGMGFGLPGGSQNAIQDWFSGSRYLMNVMEAGDDLQMPDLDF